MKTQKLLLFISVVFLSSIFQTAKAYDEKTSKSYQNLIKWWMDQRFEPGCLTDKDGKVGPGFAFLKQIEKPSMSGERDDIPFVDLKKNTLIPLTEKGTLFNGDCAKMGFDVGSAKGQKSEKCFEAIDKGMAEFFAKYSSDQNVKSFKFNCPIKFATYCKLNDQKFLTKKSDVDTVFKVLKAGMKEPAPGLVCQVNVDCKQSIGYGEKVFAKGKSAVFCSPNRSKGVAKCESVTEFGSCPIVVLNNNVYTAIAQPTPEQLASEEATEGDGSNQR